MKRFEITYFYGPDDEYFVKEETVADMAASGITLAETKCSVEATKKVLPLLKKYGMRATLCDQRIPQLVKENDIENVDATVKAVVDEYAEFDNINGWDIYDEPNNKDFEILGKIVEAFRKYSPDKETVINLFPNYAMPEQLGAKNYTEHLNEYVRIVKPDFISYDHYHFLGREIEVNENDGSLSRREALIRENAYKQDDREGFFENANEIRQKGLDEGLEQMLIVLLLEHGPYRNLTYSELLWEVNICLAYGFSRISYFTYWQPTYSDFWQHDNAMCDREGNKYQHYFDVQKINKQIMPIGEYLFGKKSVAIFHTDLKEKGATLFDGFGGIQKIEGECGVIGFFDDGSAYLVNRDFENARCFTVHAEKDIFLYENGEFINKGYTLTLTLPAGEAVLMKI